MTYSLTHPFTCSEEYNRIKSGLKLKSAEESRGKDGSSIEGVDADGLPLALRMDDYDNDCTHPVTHSLTYFFTHSLYL